NFEILNRPLFDTLPLFNKFRSPNSVLSVTAFLVPLLSFLALERIVSGKATKAEVMRSLQIGGGIAGLIALFFVALGPSFFTFASPNDAGMINRMLGGQAQPQMVQSLQTALMETRQALMRADALRTLAFVAMGAGLLWAFLREKVSQTMLLAGLGVLTLIDLFGVGMRYVNSDDFSSERQYEQNFVPRPVDTQILQDTDPDYRVLDLTVATFESASTSYFHKTIGGYHAAKLQRYQDMIDHHLRPEINQLIGVLQTPGTSDSVLNAALAQLPALNMLNAKYIVIDPEGAPLRNPAADGHAWFVSQVQPAASNQAEIDAVGNINPRSTAVVHEQFSDYLSGLTPTGEGSISLTSYAPNRVVYSSNTNAEQLAVFSEVWYGPDKGWQAYIDGEPVDHIRANYLLRALRVPAGEHEIVFAFDPASYRRGVQVSAIFSSLILLLLVGWGGWRGWQWWQAQPEEAPEVETKAKKKKKTGTK
ncbi:MAG: YfhO family protein, partial [Lewinella sp.]|nr:YfhO family protein [Lewinella sp.]